MSTPVPPEEACRPAVARPSHHVMDSGPAFGENCLVSDADLGRLLRWPGSAHAACGLSLLETRFAAQLFVPPGATRAGPGAQAGLYAARLMEPAYSGRPASR